jgi:hypothetical protein
MTILGDTIEPEEAPDFNPGGGPVQCDVPAEEPETTEDEDEESA